MGAVLGLAAFVLLGRVTAAPAVQRAMEFREVAQSADLVFIGTVSGQAARVNAANTMIFTDVTFDPVRVVSAGAASRQKDAPAVVLTYAGGTIGNLAIEVSDTPRFETGRRYFVFARDDGATYATPLVGGDQGLFEVVADQTGREFVVSPEGRAVLAGGPGGLVLGSRPVEVRDGVATFATRAPESVKGSRSLLRPVGAGMAVAPVAAPTDDSGTPPLALEAFVGLTIDEIRRAAGVGRPRAPAAAGRFYRRVGEEMVAEPLPLAAVEPRTLPAPVPDDPFAPALDILGWCGYHILPISMEEVPAGWAEFPVNQECLGTWDLYMNVFAYHFSDGTCQKGNDQDEFGGYLDEAGLQAAYNFSWGSSIAMVVSLSYDGCKRIYESDLLWNAAYSWTLDEDFAIGNSSVVLLRPTNMHELGHVWGLQRKTYNPLFYNFDVPTVMHSIYYNIVENGWGVHAPDAYLVRRAYLNQTGVPAWRDVGVESYYAQAGLHNATTDKTAYLAGDPITISNVTLENMGFAPVSNLRLRFYLSADRVITGADYQMGGYFEAATFAGEDYSVEQCTTVIPAGVPPGRYYVGAVVTIDGFGADDFPWNNRTSLFDRIDVGPGQPANVVASDGKYPDRIRISWEWAPGIDFWEVWWSKTPVFADGQLVATNVTTNHWDDTYGWPPTPYWYWVRAVSTTQGPGVYSSPDSGYKKLMPPTALTASDGTFPDKVWLTWNYALGATSSKIYRATVADPTKAALIATVNGSLEYADTSAIPLVVYYYWVKSRAGTTLSAFSNVASGRRSLGVPTGVKASNGTFFDKVRVTWTPVPGALGYEVWRSLTYSSATAVKIGTPAQALFDDTAVEPLRDYFYWVKAKSVKATSPFSSAVWGKRGLRTPVVSASSGTYGNRIRVTWTSVPLATGYKVYRSSLETLAYELIATVGVNTLAWNDYQPCGGTSWRYSVRTVGTWGSTNYSPPATGSTGACAETRLLFPAPGARIGAGTGTIVEWLSPPEAVTVALSFSPTGSAPWQPVASGLDALAGSYTWPVPVLSSTKCRLRLQAFDAGSVLVGTALSDGFFTIRALDIVQPEAGVAVAPQGVVDITWRTHATVNPVATTVIGFTSNGGETWQAVQTLEGNPGTYSWTVPLILSERCLVRVTLKDRGGRVVGVDQSDGFFAIDYP